MTAPQAAPPPRARGIDVSADNGAVPWARFLGKIEFAFMRATSWTSADTFAADPHLGTNAAESWDLWDGRLIRGYYHETRPAASIPRAQARNFIRCLGPNLVAGDLLGVAMGDNGGQGAMTPAALAAWHAEFFSALFDWIGPGHRALAYCNLSYGDSGACEGLSRHPLWFARPGAGPNPPPPGPWLRAGHSWAILQDSFGPPDSDVFGGTLAELQAFAGMPPYRR